MAYNYMYIYIDMEKNMNQGTYKPGLFADYTSAPRRYGSFFFH